MPDIQHWYDQAITIHELEELILEELNNRDFNLSKTIWATSICSDEVNNSLNFLGKHFAGPGPFRFGGISGFPFTGKTGFGAFASHIPDEGAALILYGPHIGFSGSENLGMMLREGQENQTTCCGSLIAALDTIKNNAASKFDATGDRQQANVLEFLNKQHKQILEADDPIHSVTEIAYDEIRNEMKAILESGSGALNNQKVLALGGIIINTDWDQDDMFEVRDIDLFG